MNILKGIILVSGLTATYLLGQIVGMKKVAKELSTIERGQK